MIGHRASGSGPRDELPEEIRAALAKLDARAEAAAQRVDVGRIVDGVLNDVKTAREERRANDGAGKAARWIRAAATIAGGAATAVLVTKNEAPEIAGLPLNIDSLHASDSQAIMIAVEGLRSPDTTIASAMVTVDDLSEQELRALLQAMENEESL